MYKYYKRQRTSSSAESSGSCEISVQVNSDVIISDPALRKPIAEFDTRVRDDIRREYISRGPCQPFGHGFPGKQFGQNTRCFRDVWFNQFNWLEYSISKDAAFCFVCYLFRPLNNGRRGDAFTKAGFTNWKKAIEKFKEHEGGVDSIHSKARTQLDGFTNQRQSIPCVLAGQTQETKTAHQSCLATVIDLFRLLLQQGLLKHFDVFLQWYTEWSPEVWEIIEQNASTCNQMTSPPIQKQIMNACAVETTLAILNDIGDKRFSLMVDVPCDYMKEPLTLVLRYVNRSGEIMERFLAAVNVIDTSAKCLKGAFDDLFAKHGLSLSRLRGQGYSGALSLRNELHGLKSLILLENPYAMYVHNFAHKFQSVIVAVSKTNGFVSDFFGLVDMIVNMAGSPCKRRDQIQQIEHDRMLQLLKDGDVTNSKEKSQEGSFAGRGDTQWGSRYVTLLRLHTMWPSVIEVLENVLDDGVDVETRGLSITLIWRMESYYFVFILHLMKHLLEITNDLSVALQERERNIVQAIPLIEIVKHRIQDFKETRWDGFVKEVEIFCMANSIDVDNMDDIVNPRKRMKRDGRVVTNYHYYRMEIYCEVLDFIAEEMENRFPRISLELLLSIACLDPTDGFSNFDVKKLLQLAELYPDDFSLIDRAMLSSELEIFIHNVRNHDHQFSGVCGLESLSKRMVASRKSKVFPLVYRLIELALLLPVVAPSVERVSSTMNIVETDLGNKMEDEWMNDNLVVCIEKEVLSSIDNEAILQRFQKMQDSDSTCSSNVK